MHQHASADIAIINPPTPPPPPPPHPPPPTPHHPHPHPTPPHPTSPVRFFFFKYFVLRTHKEMKWNYIDMNSNVLNIIMNFEM